MEVRFCITTTRRSRSGLLNPPATSSANSCKGVQLGTRQEAVEMTKEENPQNQERGFPSFLESANPRFPHSHRTTTTAALDSPPKQSHKTTMASLASFLT